MNDINVYRLVAAVREFDRELKKMNLTRDDSVRVSTKLDGYDVDICIQDSEEDDENDEE